jgi:hypothetical protein
LTTNERIEKGLKVKPGEKSAKVKNLPLFHRRQVLPIAETEKAEIKAKAAAAEARQTASRKAKVILISEGTHPSSLTVEVCCNDGSSPSDAGDTPRRHSHYRAGLIPPSRHILRGSAMIDPYNARQFWMHG